MEPVPETSQMDNFHPTRPPPRIPTLRIHESSPTTCFPGATSPSLRIPNFSIPRPSPTKPPNIRRVTEPTHPVLPWDTIRQPPALPLRTASPFGTRHTRSQSLAAPMLSRAKSMPGTPNLKSSFAFGIQRPESPAGASASPSRNRVMRKPADEAFPSTKLPVRMSSLDLGRLDTGMGIKEEANSSIPEEEEESSQATVTDSEPNLPGVGASRSSSPSLYPGYTSGAYIRQRRPSSPLRNYNYASSSSSIYSNGTGATTPTSPSSMSSSHSPLYASSGTSGVGRYDAFSGYNFPPSVSSNPTTPSSLRSRSPSVSSLETIPDNPDDEEAAVEAERVARKLRREGKEGEEDEGGSGSGSEGESGKSAEGIMGRGRRTGAGSGMGRDKSKRWSVCGAERRQDLDLETIWED